MKNKAENLEVSFVPMSEMNEHSPYFQPKESRELKAVYKGYSYFGDNDVLLAKITPCFENGKSGVAQGLKNGIGFGSTEFIVLRPGEKVLPEWVYLFIASDSFIEEGRHHMTGSAGQKRLTAEYLATYQIPVPSLEIQKEHIAAMKNDWEMINESKELISRYESKIATVLGEV